MWNRHRKIITVGGFLLALVGGALFLLSISGTLCIERTGMVPGFLYGDTLEFREHVSTMRTEAISSLTRVFEPETGFFIYGLSPDGTRSSGNNDIRQLLGSRVIAEESMTEESLSSLHEENLRAIFRDWYKEEGGVGYVYVDNKSKLGANAMLLRTLVASPYFESYRNEAKKLVLSIMILQNEDGSFEPWLKEPSYAYDKDYLLTFYSGEAILALLEYEKKTGDALAFSIAQRAQDFYLIEYVEKIEENYYPAYVPWHTLSLALLYEKTGEKRYADAIFTLTDKLLEIQDTEEFIGRFYNPDTPEYGTPHASSDAVYTEGLATAYRVAERLGDRDREVRYGEALMYAFGNLEQLQFEKKWYRFFDDRESAGRLSGGIQTGRCDTRVRVDTTAHTVDALNAILKAIE